MKRMGKKTCGEEGKLKGRRSEEEGRRWGKTVIMYIHVQRLSKNELWNLQSATHQVWATWNCLPKKRNKMKVTLTASLWSRCCLSAWIWTEDSAAICWTSWHKTGSWETSFWSNSRLIWGTETELCILYRTVKRRPERNLVFKTPEKNDLQVLVDGEEWLCLTASAHQRTCDWLPGPPMPTQGSLLPGCPSCLLLSHHFLFLVLCLADALPFQQSNFLSFRLEPAM